MTALLQGFSSPVMNQVLSFALVTFFFSGSFADEKWYFPAEKSYVAAGKSYVPDEKWYFPDDPDDEMYYEVTSQGTLQEPLKTTDDLSINPISSKNVYIIIMDCGCQNCMLEDDDSCSDNDSYNRLLNCGRKKGKDFKVRRANVPEKVVEEWLRNQNEDL